MALAFALLKGPSTPITDLSEMNESAFFELCAGSCAWPPGGTSSRKYISSLYGLPSSVTPPLAFAWSIASCIPLRVGIPSLASPPEPGRSTAIFTVSPLAAPPLGAVVASAAGAVVAVAASPAGATGSVGAAEVAGVAVDVSVPQADSSMLRITRRATVRNPSLDDLMLETLLHTWLR